MSVDINYMVFNKNLPIVTNVGPLPPLEVCPDYQRASLREIYGDLPECVRTIVQNIPLVLEHRKVLFDIRLQELHPGDYSCLPGWHCDGPAQPMNPDFPENIHLFVLGGNPTQFVKNPVRAEVSAETHQDEVELNDPEPWDLPLGKIGTYGRFHFHRGVEAKEKIYRLLIRVIESNILSYNNRPKPTHHGAISGAPERQAAIDWINGKHGLAG